MDFETTMIFLLFVKQTWFSHVWQGLSLPWSIHFSYHNIMLTLDQAFGPLPASRATVADTASAANLTKQNKVNPWHLPQVLSQALATFL